MTLLDREAVESAVRQGIVVVVSAGNEGIDASTVTPAHAASAITVGAYDAFDQFASFSNYGPVVDILAPGADIASLALDANKQVAPLMSDGTSMASAYVAGAAALYLSEHPYASPAQVRDALLRSGRDEIQGVPAGTTNKTVYVGEDGSFTTGELPPFFRYAITAGNEVRIENGAEIYADAGLGVNASLFANNNLQVKGLDNYVEGFGYHRSGLNMDLMPAAVFQPVYNPTGLAPTQKAVEANFGTFLAEDYAHLATRVTNGDLFLSGHYALGTEANPVIWYVEGSIKTEGDVTLSGYGILLSTDGVEIKHSLTTEEGLNENTVAFYTSKQFKVRKDVAGEVAFAGQVLANDKIAFESPVAMRGTIVSLQDRVESKAGLKLYHQLANPALVTPIWPAGN